MAAFTNYYFGWLDRAQGLFRPCLKTFADPTDCPWVSEDVNPAIRVQISVGPHPSCFFLHGLYACEEGFIDNQTIINKLLLQDRR